MSTFVILTVIGLIVAAVLLALVVRGPFAGSQRRPLTPPNVPEPPSGPRSATQATRSPGILPDSSARKAEEITPHTGVPLRDPGPGP